MMFRDGQFGGKHVFMEDLLSRPVEISQPESAQLNLNVPGIAVPTYDDGGGLAEGIQGGVQMGQGGDAQNGWLGGLISGLLSSEGGGKPQQSDNTLPPEAYDSPAYGSPYGGGGY